MTGESLLEGLLRSGRGAAMLNAVVAELTAADVYWDARCSGIPCVGENHVEGCPVLTAWQDLKAASEKRRAL